MLETAVLAHISALNEALETAIDDENDVALEIALLLLDLYETILEQAGMIIVYRGEELH